MGIAFSTPNGNIPSSLKNIFLELKNDLGIIRTQSNLSDWVSQGVWLFNPILTLPKHVDNMNLHEAVWLSITQCGLRRMAQDRPDIIWVCLGKLAERSLDGVDIQNKIVTTHPSPLSAKRGFLGSRVFSKINQILQHKNCPPIKWG